jgi:hypothetical protein
MDVRVTPREYVKGLKRKLPVSVKDCFGLHINTTGMCLAMDGLIDTVAISKYPRVT